MTKTIGTLILTSPALAAFYFLWTIASAAGL
jgi:hypothetical protein